MRTGFGRYVDKQEINLTKLSQISGVSTRTLSRYCNDSDFFNGMSIKNGAAIIDGLCNYGRNVGIDWTTETGDAFKIVFFSESV